MIKETIGSATLYLGDCREILPSLSQVDAVIVDPPYSEKTHAGHDSIAKELRDSGVRSALNYAALTPDDVKHLAEQYVRISKGWIVWLTDFDLAPEIGRALKQNGRYTFTPLPFFQPGRSVRISGDGPNSWTDLIVVARTKEQVKWGTLPGGYVAGPGWKDKVRMGGKPTALMDALVADYTRPGDTVLDSHMGGGTTGVSCLRAGRKFIGCEVDQEAFEKACRRIEQAESQGQLFGLEHQPQVQESFA